MPDSTDHASSDRDEPDADGPSAYEPGDPILERIQRRFPRLVPSQQLDRLRSIDWRARARRYLIEERGVVALPLWLAAGYIVYFALLLAWPYPPFPPDSWSYYELSRSFPADPMHLRVFRSYLTTEPYSASFPPLWPLSIAIVDMIAGFGVNSGHIAGGLYLAGSAICIDIAGFRWFGRRGTGPAALLVLMIYTPMIQEVASAAAIAPTIFFTSAIVLLLSNPWPLTDRQIVRLGLVSGALALTRFDTALFVGLLPPALLGLRAIPRRRVVRSYASLAVGVSPWIVFSLVRFRTPWASDNGRTALAAEPTFVLDYLPNGVPTLLDQPGEWFTRVRGLYGSTFSTTWAALDEARLPMILAGVLGASFAAAVALAHQAQRGSGTTFQASLVSTGRALVLHPATRTLVAVAALQFAAVSFALSTTGYIQSRYLTVTVYLVELALIALILSIPHHLPLLAPAASCVALLWLGFIRYGSFSHPVPLIEGYPYTPVVLSPFDVFRNVALCLKPSDRPMFTQQAGVGYMVGALSDAGGVIEPTNWQRLTPDERLRFFKEFKITHLYLAPELSREASTRRTAVDRYLITTGLPSTASTEVCTAGLYTLDLGES